MTSEYLAPAVQWYIRGILMLANRIEIMGLSSACTLLLRTCVLSMDGVMGCVDDEVWSLIHAVLN